MTSPIALELGPGQQDVLPRFRAAIDELFPPLTITPFASEGLCARLRSAASRELQLTHITANTHLVERRPGVHRAREHAFYKITLQLSGSATMSQGNRESTLDPGTITLYDTARSYDLRSDEDFSFLVAMFPKHALPLPDGLAGELAAQPIPGDSGVGAVLSAFLGTLNDNLPLLHSQAAAGLGRTFLDLLATLIGETLEVDAGAQAKRTAALMRVLAYIDDRLGDPELDPAAIAAANYLSVRHLYNLFSPTGTTVSQWIKRRRLDRARTDLADPLRAADTVAAISARWGFEDAGYFSRVFKQSFGQTPGAWRDSLRAERLGAA
jgi:AraC-like DNA-binding protein